MVQVVQQMRTDQAPSGRVRAQTDRERERGGGGSEVPKAVEATHREWCAGTGCP